MVKLRPWQSECVLKALNYYQSEKHFLVNAAPGAGKTITACVIANELIKTGQVESVIVIAPRRAVVDQWTADFKNITSRSMLKITGADVEPEGYGTDFAATWSAVQGLLPAFQSICSSRRTLVICDEHHHAAIEAAWGNGAFGAFSDASPVLVLTGTPIRSDGKESVWLAYDDRGAISHPDAGTYTISYGEAVDLGYCRPITFHRHEGVFSVSLQDKDGGGEITVTSKGGPVLPGNLEKIESLKKALDFYKLVCTPSFDTSDKPDTNSYHGTMIQWGSEKLEDIRCDMPQAGGLIIAPDIAFAEYMAELIELIEGEKPFIVHSNVANPEARIAAFRNSDKRWIVSVGMISEGVDIPRLRVLLYIPYARTELSFRQAMGRVVRNFKKDEDTRAYVVIPTHSEFEKFAARVEDEMSPSSRTEPEKPRHKICPVCETENARDAVECSNCGHQFTGPTPAQKKCEECDGLNPIGAKECMHCGSSFGHEFTVSLREALRVGVIARGMEISEEDTQLGEDIANTVNARILATGDARLIAILNAIPEEAYGQLASIMTDAVKH